MVTLACAVVAYLRSLFLPRHKLAALRRLWEGWSEALIIVKPETVVSWHRAGFRRFP
jgi:hypothetical protein